MALPATFISRTINGGPTNTVIVNAPSGTKYTWQGINTFDNGVSLTRTAVSGAQFLVINSQSNFGGGKPNGENTFLSGLDIVNAKMALFRTVNSPIENLTFGGLSQILIPAGGYVVTDPVTGQLPSAGWYYRLEFETTRSGQALPQWVGEGGTFIGSTRTGVDVMSTPTVTGFTDDGLARIHGPLAILGIAVAPPSGIYTSNRLSAVGDSIADGGQFFTTAINNANTAYFWMPQAGHAAADYTGRRDLYASSRKDLLFNAPTLIYQWGVNDLRTNLPSGSLIASLGVVAADFKAAGGRRIIVTTLTPITTSTDNWTTQSGQTVSFDPHWTNYNNYVRNLTSAQVSNLEVYVLDVASGLNNISDPNKWPSGITTDGVHPNSSGNSLLTAAITNNLVSYITVGFSALPSGPIYYPQLTVENRVHSNCQKLSDLDAYAAECNSYVWSVLDKFRLNKEFQHIRYELSGIGGFYTGNYIT